MRKPILAGLLVAVVALGAMGAAFATDLDFSNVGALSTGTADVPQVNVDGVTWVVESWGDEDYDTEPEAYWVKLSFDSYLPAGSHIGVNVLGESDEILRHEWHTLTAPLPKAENVSIKWDGGAVPVKDIYGLRATVNVNTA